MQTRYSPHVFDVGPRQQPLRYRTKDLHSFDPNLARGLSGVAIVEEVDAYVRKVGVVRHSGKRRHFTDQHGRVHEWITLNGLQRACNH
ncbi:hypothetical protein D3C87_1718900 [compost metagenome]